MEERNATEEVGERTLHAQEAFNFADIFGYKFSRTHFGSDPKRKLKLADPEESTDGGRKARQPITLITDDDGGRSLVCGWIDVPKKLAELRSFNGVSQQFEARYGGKIDMPRVEYDRALDDLQTLFRSQKIVTKVVEALPAAPGVSNPGKVVPGATPTALPTGSAFLFIGLGVAIGFLAGYIVFGL